MNELHYPGDSSVEIVGQIVGPTLLGQMLTIYAADYDPTTDVTTAHLRPSSVPEVEADMQQWVTPAAYEVKS